MKFFFGFYCNYNNILLASWKRTFFFFSFSGALFNLMSVESISECWVMKAEDECSVWKWRDLCRPAEKYQSVWLFHSISISKRKTYLVILEARNRNKLLIGLIIFIFFKFSLLFVFPVLYPRQQFNLESNGRLLTWGIIPLLHSPGILLHIQGNFRTS